MEFRLVATTVAVIACACVAHAVTPGDGPGGVGTTDGSSQLALWVKADTLGLANGAPVPNWDDASGNGRALAQPNAALQPQFIAGALGGYPVVRFTADYFNSLVLPSTSNEFAIVAVVKPTKTGAYHNIVEGQGGVRPMLWIDTLGNYEFNFNTGAVTAASGAYDVVFAIKRNAGPQFSQLCLNGPTVTASSPNGFNIAASQTYTLFNRSGASAFNGDVAELIVYSTALSSAEIGKIGYYLQQKYSLPSNFPLPFPILSSYQQNPVTYVVNEAITPNLPIVSGGTPTNFTIDPALPAGLALDPTTGAISGTPTALVPQNNYRVTATFTGEPDSSTQLSLGVTTPTLVGYSRSPVIFTGGGLPR